MSIETIINSYEDLIYIAKYEDEILLIETEDWRLYKYVTQCNNNGLRVLNSCKLQVINLYNDYDDY